MSSRQLLSRTAPLSRTSSLNIVTSPYFYFRFVGIVKVFPRPGALSERNFVRPTRAICHGQNKIMLYKKKSTTDWQNHAYSYGKQYAQRGAPARDPGYDAA